MASVLVSDVDFLGMDDPAPLAQAIANILATGQSLETVVINKHPIQISPLRKNELLELDYSKMELVPQVSLPPSLLP